MPHSADEVEFRTGVWNPQSITLSDDSLQGRLWPIVQRLRAGASARDIAADTKAPRSEVDALVDQLISEGIIQDTVPSALEAFTAGLGSGEFDAERPSSILLMGDTSLHGRISSELEEVAKSVPVRVLDDSATLYRDFQDLRLDSFVDGLEIEVLKEKFADLQGSLVVLALAQNDPVRFQILDRLALAVSFTWIHATIDGPFVYVGPTVVPGRSANYEAFEARVSMNMRERASYLRYKEAIATGNAEPGRTQVFRPVESLLAAHVALEITNWVAGGSDFTFNKVLGIYLPTMEIAFHEILRLPQEAVRGPFPNRDEQTLYFDMRQWYAQDA